MAVTRKAEVHWEGDLMSGKGRVTTRSSPVLEDVEVTWASRTEDPAGRTSPEELIAAAHASCFSMALSSALAKAGTPPTSLDVSATVHFGKVDGGFGITKSALTVRGKVPNLDADGFAKAADGAKEGCPVSKALQGNVELTVEATLES